MAVAMAALKLRLSGSATVRTAVSNRLQNFLIGGQPFSLRNSRPRRRRSRRPPVLSLLPETQKSRSDRVQELAGALSGTAPFCWNEEPMILNCGDGGSSGSEGGVRCGGSETGLKKGPWTAAEDSILMEYVRKHGEGNWNAVQRNSGLNRCGKSCRLRWANHLRPNLKKGAFSAEEERLILELHAKFGNKWARMAAQLPGRTDNEIKNYWNTRVKRRQRQGLPLYPYDIRPLSAPTTPSGSVSAPTTPTNPSAATLFHFPTQTLTQIHPLSPLSSPNTLSFSPSTSSSPPFTFHRPPPILGPPVRFNRSNGRFSLPLSPSLPQNPNPTLIQSPPPPHPQPASFQFPAMETFRTQFETQKMAMTGSINLANSSELPSNQIIMESKVVPPANHSGLLDDLLAEAQALACEDAFKRTHCFEEKRFFNGFPKMEEPSNPAHFFLGADTEKEEPRNGVSLGHDDWSRLLNGIPPAVQVGEWCDNRGEFSNGHSSNFGGDNGGGVDMQNLASFFPVASESDVGRTPTSCPWDNLPGIC